MNYDDYIFMYLFTIHTAHFGEGSIKIFGLFFLILTCEYAYRGRKGGREEGWERERDVKEKYWLVASYVNTDQGLKPQPRYVP